MELTQHGELRIRKRLGLGRKSVKKLALEAYSKGIPRTVFTGNVRNYLDKFYIPYRKKGTELYVHNHNVFVFYHDLLITAWTLPQRFRKQVGDLNKIKRGEM